jgi:hypothetical protein
MAKKPKRLTRAMVFTVLSTSLLLEAFLFVCTRPCAKSEQFFNYTELSKDLDGNFATPKSFVEIKEWDVLNWTESWYEI